MKNTLSALLLIALSGGAFQVSAKSPEGAKFVSKEDIKEMRTVVREMSQEEVSKKHIELFDVVTEDPSDKNCYEFGVFDRAALKEDKIGLMDFEGRGRAMRAARKCRVVF